MRAALLLFLFAASCAGISALAQAAPASQASGEAAGPQAGKSQTIAAAEQEDEEAVYKKSASVRWFGHLLHLSPDASSAAFEYFNFAVLAGVVVFFLARAVPKAFRERQGTIDRQLVEARAASADAQERLKVVEQKLTRLDGEIAELRGRAERESADDERRIKASIEAERKKIVSAAEQEIAAAAAVARRDLRLFAAEFAMESVMGRLRVSEQQDRALVTDFAAGLEKRRN